MVIMKWLWWWVIYYIGSLWSDFYCVQWCLPSPSSFSIWVSARPQEGGRSGIIVIGLKNASKKNLWNKVEDFFAELLLHPMVVGAESVFPAYCRLKESHQHRIWNFAAVRTKSWDKEIKTLLSFQRTVFGNRLILTPAPRVRKDIGWPWSKMTMLAETSCDNKC